MGCIRSLLLQLSFFEDTGIIPPGERIIIIVPIPCHSLNYTYRKNDNKHIYFSQVPREQYKNNTSVKPLKH